MVLLWLYRNICNLENMYSVFFRFEFRFFKKPVKILRFCYRFGSFSGEFLIRSYRTNFSVLIIKFQVYRKIFFFGFGSNFAYIFIFFFGSESTVFFGYIDKNIGLFLTDNRLYGICQQFPPNFVLPITNIGTFGRTENM